MQLIFPLIEDTDQLIRRNQYHGVWWLCDTRSQGLDSHDSVLVHWHLGNLNEILLDLNVPADDLWHL